MAGLSQLPVGSRPSPHLRYGPGPGGIGASPTPPPPGMHARLPPGTTGPSLDAANGVAFGHTSGALGYQPPHQHDGHPQSTMALSTAFQHRQHGKKDGRRAGGAAAQRRRADVQWHDQQGGHNTDGRTLAMPKHNSADQTFAGMIDKQGATPTATPTAPKRSPAGQMHADMASKMGGSAPFSTWRRNLSARRSSIRPLTWKGARGQGNSWPSAGLTSNAYFSPRGRAATAAP